MTEQALTEAQRAALAVVDASGAAFLSSRTNSSTNHVNVSAARALVRAGILTEFLASDGIFVRRAEGGHGESA